MSTYHKVRAVACMYLMLMSAFCGAEEKSVLEGSWQIISYLHAKNQVRYETEGYMMFGKEHWLQLQFFNRDERAMDFSEAHHGTYQITGRCNTAAKMGKALLHKISEKQFRTVFKIIMTVFAVRLLHRAWVLLR